ncbi:MAG: translation initiation factor IF-2 [Thermoplasmata archaeon]
MSDLRQPILSLLGHVDHGKTTLLDQIAGSGKAQHEAGGITQHIGAIEVPRATVLELTKGILDATSFQVPGLLFIDTPGHRSFETMRRRGGALADLAILVIDAREGVMPQTRESIAILRQAKTPFAVALTKIDLVSGWRRPTGPVGLADHLTRCGDAYGRLLDEHLYQVAEDLLAQGFSAERYDRVSDFTRNVGIVPISAKSGVGVPELLALVVGLAQRFLKDELAKVAGAAEGTVLERSEQRGVGPVGSIILYRGYLSVGDDLVVNGRDEPFSTRVRGIYRPAPTPRGRAPKQIRLDSLDTVAAAAGVYLAAPGIENAMPGGLLKVVRSPEERAAAVAELTRESQPLVEVVESGVALAADTLGGLEALVLECGLAKIPVHSAEVGPVNRPMVLREASVKDPTHRAVLAFNVPVLPDAQPEGEDGPVKIFSGEVMYRLLELYATWRDARLAELNAQRRVDMPHPAKFRILPGFVFRSSKPAICGIKVISGQLRAGVRLMDAKGNEVGLLRGLQRENASVATASEGEELAASMEGVVLGRTVAEGDTLYVALPESVARALKSETITETERSVLDEVVRIRRAGAPFWGQ